jgi:hypothetical protein
MVIVPHIGKKTIIHEMAKIWLTLSAARRTVATQNRCSGQINGGHRRVFLKIESKS